MAAKRRWRPENDAAEDAGLSETPMEMSLNVQTSVFLPDTQKVLAVFGNGYLVHCQMSQTYQWQSFTPETPPVMLHRAAIVHDEKCMGVAFCPTFNEWVLTTLSPQNAVQVWSCASGLVKYNWDLSACAPITQLAIGKQRLVVAGKACVLNIAVYCVPFPALTNLECPVLRRVERLAFDEELDNLCWIVASTGIFSIDVTLPLDLQAPELALFDGLGNALAEDSLLLYRQLLMEYHQQTCAYHALEDTEKMQRHRVPLPVAEHGTPWHLCRFVMAPMERPPLHLSPRTSRYGNRLIAAFDYCILANQSRRQVQQYPLPQHSTIVQTGGGNVFFVCKATGLLCQFNDNAPGKETTIVSLPPLDTHTQPMLVAHPIDPHCVFFSGCRHAIYTIRYSASEKCMTISV